MKAIHAVKTPTPKRNSVIETLGTSEQELKLCRKAFKGVRIGQYAWHCHHGTLVEDLAYTPRERMLYVNKYKPWDEVPLRLRLFRPVKSKKFIRFLNDVDNGTCKCEQSRIDELIQKYHAQECKGCTWDSVTIFGSGLQHAPLMYRLNRARRKAYAAAT